MEDSPDRLRDARIKAGFQTIAEAARQKRLHKQNLSDHEAGRRKIGPDHAKVYAKAFKVRPEWILFGTGGEAQQVPVVGYIGAGAEFYAIDDHGKGAGLDSIDAPPDCPPNAVAVSVRGDSMYPTHFDGDILIYAERRYDLADFINRRPCICGLADGRILVKTPTRGSSDGLYTLTSFNAPPIIDIVLEWCAKIEWVQPR